MATLHPFRALRPSRDNAVRVAAPPYDVVNTREAREIARGNPDSYLHVSRPEIDLPEGTDEHADAVYARGARNLADFRERGVLRPDAEPHFYVYAQKMGTHRQVGLVACASVAEYDADLIKKHEKTRADKEDDRTRHIDEMGAHDEPVFLTYRASSAIDAAVAEVMRGRARVRHDHPGRRRAPALGGGRGGQRAHRRALPVGARPLRGRRAPPLGGGLPRPRAAQGQAGRARPLPRRGLPARPDADPGLQPAWSGTRRGERPARDPGRDREGVRPLARRPARAGRAALVRRLPRGALVAGAGPPGQLRREGPGGLARLLDPAGPGAGPDLRHRRPAPRHRTSTSWAASAARRSWNGG